MSILIQAGDDDDDDDEKKSENTNNAQNAPYLLRLVWDAGELFYPPEPLDASSSGSYITCLGYNGPILSPGHSSLHETWLGEIGPILSPGP